MNRVSRLSRQPIYVPFRMEDPILGPINLLGVSSAIAITQFDPRPTDFAPATQILLPDAEPLPRTPTAADTWTAPDGEEYYIFARDIVPNEVAAGTYHVWIRVEIEEDKHIVRAGRIEVY